MVDFTGKYKKGFFQMELDKQLFHSTIKVISKKANSPLISAGTGFFFAFNMDGKDLYTIITNKHVIEDFDITCLTFKYKDEKTNNFYTAKVEFSSNLWINHPNGLDLAVLKLDDIAAIINTIFNINKLPIYIKWLDESLIPNSENAKMINYIEDVLVIGYPNGLSDEVNHLPIARRGITATPFPVDFNGSPEFLIDSAIYPGSSGSPVVIYNSSYVENGTYIINPRLIFIGINCATHLSGTFIRNEENDTIQVANNLGVCIKSSCILDFKPLL